MKTTEIKVWMLKKGIRQTDIARELGITPTTVWQVIHGLCKSQRVVEWLRTHGCPSQFLIDEESPPDRGKNSTDTEEEKKAA